MMHQRLICAEARRSGVECRERKLGSGTAPPWWLLLSDDLSGVGSD